MKDFTFEPYEHPPAPVMTPAEMRAWCEPVPPQMTMEERARFHGLSVDSYEQLVLAHEDYSVQH